MSMCMYVCVLCSLVEDDEDLGGIVPDSEDDEEGRFAAKSLLLSLHNLGYPVFI